MVLSTAVPQDIINAIVDDLHDDQDALKQCAVTSRAFVEPAQRYLFSIIHLTHQYYALPLSEVFKGRPTIASYVQELYIGDAASALQDSDSPFPYLLAAVNNVKVFSCEVDSEAGFMGRVDGDFKTFPPAVQSAFLGIVKSPRLLTLRLNNIKNLPYDILTGSSSLKSLHLLNTTFRKKCVDPAVSSDPAASHIIGMKYPLESLTFDETSAEGVYLTILANPNTSIDLTELREVFFYGEDTSTQLVAMKILAAAGSMHALGLGFAPFKPAQAYMHRFTPGLSKLRSLTFKFSFDLSVSPLDVWDNYDLPVAWACKFLSLPAIPGTITDITFILEYREYGSFRLIPKESMWSDLFDMDQGPRLDAILAEKYKNLEKIDFLVVADKKTRKAPPLVLRLPLAQFLPLAAQRGVIAFEPREWPSGQVLQDGQKAARDPNNLLDELEAFQEYMSGAQAGYSSSTSSFDSYESARELDKMLDDAM